MSISKGSNNGTSEGQVPDDLLKSLDLGYRRKKRRSRRTRAIAADTKPVEKIDPEEKRKQNDQVDWDSYPAWLKKMNSKDIMQLPFSEVPFKHDIYEQALVVLYRKHWRINKIRFVHFFLLSPIFWPPFFSYRREFTYKIFFLRWIILLTSIGGIGFGTFKALEHYDAMKWMMPVGTLMASMLILLHGFGSIYEYQKWSGAYKNVKNRLKRIARLRSEDLTARKIKRKEAKKNRKNNKNKKKK